MYKLSLGVTIKMAVKMLCNVLYVQCQGCFSRKACSERLYAIYQRSIFWLVMSNFSTLGRMLMIELLAESYSQTST